MFKIKLEFNIYVNRSKAGMTKVSWRRSTQTEKEKSVDGIGMFVQKELQYLSSSHSYSTVQNYLTAVRSFCTYAGGTDVPLDKINEDLIMGYQRWLQQKGVCMNTISCYLRSLRAIYAKAVNQGIMSDSSPFGRSFTGSERTVKRSLTEEDIRKIRFLHIRRGSMTDFARDIFLFSFYTQGMPFIDMAYLKHSQIKGAAIHYKRHKTGQQVTVGLKLCMQSIIDKYAQEGREYVFPIISSSEENEAHREYLGMLGRYNKELKKIARLAGISGNLTSYSARHTWASVAFDRNVDLPVISKALGHTDTKTTMVYIREINDKRLVEANEKILDSFGLI